MAEEDVVMKFTPIKLPYLQETLNLTPEQALEEYSIWGGRAEILET